MNTMNKLLITCLLFQTSKFLILNAEKCLSNTLVNIFEKNPCVLDVDTVLENNLMNNYIYVKLIGQISSLLNQFKALYFLESGYYAVKNFKSKGLGAEKEFNLQLNNFKYLKGAFIHREERATKNDRLLYSIGKNYFIIDGFSDFRYINYKKIYEIHFYKENFYNFTDDQILTIEKDIYESKIRTNIEQLIINSLNKLLISNYYPNLKCLIINLKNDHPPVTSEFFDQLKSLRFIIINSNKNYNQVVEKWMEIVNSLHNLNLLLHYNKYLKIFDLIVIIKSNLIEKCAVDNDIFNCTIFKNNMKMSKYQSNVSSNSSKGINTKSILKIVKMSMKDKNFTIEQTKEMNNLLNRMNFTSITKNDRKSEQNVKLDTKNTNNILDNNDQITSTQLNNMEFQVNTSTEILKNIVPVILTSNTGSETRNVPKVISNLQTDRYKNILFYISIFLTISNIILVLLVSLLVIINNQQRKLIQFRNIQKQENA